MYTIEEKIKIIEQSESFLDLNKDVLPKAHKEDYYFVSYSHKDYKEVMKDILLLEENGINIWYDSDMHIGENWEDIAENYISKFQCKGIIFYLSENSILSKACNKEVAYVLSNNKQFFSINMPLPGEKNIMSGLAMLLKLKDAGHSVSQALINNFERAFSDKFLFLSYSDTIQRKKEQIEKLVGEERFTFEYEYNSNDDYWNTKGNCSKLTECKDNSINKLYLKDNYEINLPNGKHFGEMLPLKFIDKCVFANLFKLTEISLPARLYSIDSFAFANCYKLETVNLNGGSLNYINDYAFFRCKSLDINRIDCKFIGKYAFNNCTSLKEVQIKANEIGSFCFGNCNSLEKINFEFAPIQISSYAFAYCKNLNKIQCGKGSANEIVSRGGELQLDDSVFSDCESLTELAFKGKINFTNASSLFNSCANLTKVTFDLSKKLRKLPDHFFFLCHNLTEVNGIESVKIYGEKCFYECDNLQNINLENAVEICAGAFIGTSLTEVNLLNVKKIESNAFAGIPTLKKVVIGEKLKEIHNEAFYELENLKEIEIYSKNFNYSWNTFYHLEPEVITLCNYNYLLDLLDNCCSKLRTLYLAKGLATAKTLNEIGLFVFKRQKSDKEGFDKFTVLRENKYGCHIGKLIILTLANGDQDYVFCQEADYDEERGEFYLVADDIKYYESEIQSVSKTYSL